MKDSLLKRALTFDIWASAVTSVFAVAGAGLIGSWLDVSVWLPVVFGVTLIPWVWLLVTTARRNPMRDRDVKSVVFGNIAFGVIVMAIVFGFPDALSTSGKWIVAIFGLATVDLGLAEWMGMRRMSASLASEPLAS